MTARFDPGATRERWRKSVAATVDLGNPDVADAAVAADVRWLLMNRFDADPAADALTALADVALSFARGVHDAAEAGEPLAAMCYPGAAALSAHLALVAMRLADLADRP